MDYDKDKVDEMTLALLYLVMSRDGEGGQAWKTFEWATMDRLHEKGWISDPKSRSASVWMSKEGADKAEELFRKHFAVK